LNAPDAVQQVFVDAGYGWNTQNIRAKQALRQA